MKRFKLTRRNLILIIFGTIMFASIDILQNHISNLTNNYPKIVLDDNWTFSINNQTPKEHIKLSEFSFPSTTKGDVIVMSTILPKEKISNPVLIFGIFHSSLQVTVDNELIYQYGTDMIKNNKLIGNTSHTISIPDDYAGKRLEYTIYVGEYDAFSKLESTTLIDETNALDYHVRIGFQNLFISTILFVFGVIVMLTIVIKGSFVKELRKLFWIALMSASFATWILSNSSYFGYILRNKEIVSFIEYFSLYLITPAGLMYFYENFKDKKDKKIAQILVTISTTFLTTIVVLHILNIAHISYFLMYSHIITLVSIFIALIRTFNLRKYKHRSEQFSTYAFSWLLIAGIIELIRFNLMKYVLPTYTYNTLMPTSVLVFVIFMIVSYLEYIREYLADVASKKVLTKLAYNDTLTGVANRNCCEEKLNELRKHNVKEFSIVYFDLNNLKKLNDSNGHIAGDRYICDFTSLLTKCFSDYGLIGRMGGDEFIVISNNCDSSLIIKNIVKMIEDADRPDSDYEEKKISFAYGYAVSTLDSPSEVNELLTIADKRMYDCKKKQKRQGCV